MQSILLFISEHRIANSMMGKGTVLILTLIVHAQVFSG